MHLQAQSLTTHFTPSLAPLKRTTNSTYSCSFLIKPYPSRRFSSSRSFECSLSTATISEPTHAETLRSAKPYPAEVSRTIMELSSVGTLSSLSKEGWPLGIGVRFAVDEEGTPVLCFNESNGQFSIDDQRRSSLHVQLEQCGLRTPQCTIQGNLDRPQGSAVLKQLRLIWRERFGEEVDEDLLYLVTVDKVLQVEDFREVGIWVASSDYKSANPDPLRDVAEKLVNEINTNNIEDINRFCNVYVDLDFQVLEAKLIWVDRLGFDMRIFSPREGIFEVRIPFPREVTDEKSAKSAFNGMSQLAWEVEKNFVPLDFDKVKLFKVIK